MSFEEIPGIKILAYGQAELPGGRIGSHKPVPVEYELSRDRYTLFIEADSSEAASYIRAESLEGLDLQVKVTAEVEAVREGRAPRTPTCGDFVFPYKVKDDQLLSKAKDDQLLRYEWWGYIEWDRCSFSNISADGLAMRFRVMDNAGNLSGEESLPFRLIRK